MKANEFIKKFGLLKSKAIVGLMNCGTVNYDGNSVNYDDLKRLVESHELVNMWGGYDILKDSLSNDSDERLKQAVADVELCQ